MPIVDFVPRAFVIVVKLVCIGLPNGRCHELIQSS